MAIPVDIETELGRAPMTPAFLRARLNENRFPDDATPSPSELAGALGLVGGGWNELLKAGFPQPCTVAEARQWFAARGWLTD